MSLVILCEFRAKPDSENEAVRVARALAAEAATESGTLRYQWFRAPKPGHLSIIEEYVDADAAETHNHHVAALLGELFAVVDLVSIAFYGALNEYLREWAVGRDGVSVHVAL